MNVSFPVQPGPASSPVAVNCVGSVEGVFVMPGLKVIRPVGATGVPPQVQNVSPWLADALAVAARQLMAVAAIASTNTRDLMVSSFSPLVDLPAGEQLDGVAPEPFGEPLGGAAAHEARIAFVGD